MLFLRTCATCTHTCWSTAARASCCFQGLSAWTDLSTCAASLKSCRRVAGVEFHFCAVGAVAATPHGTIVVRTRNRVLTTAVREGGGREGKRRWSLCPEGHVFWLCPQPEAPHAALGCGLCRAVGLVGWPGCCGACCAVFVFVCSCGARVDVLALSVSAQGCWFLVPTVL
jgi:hypothetical protein